MMPDYSSKLSLGINLILNIHLELRLIYYSRRFTLMNNLLTVNYLRSSANKSAGLCEKYFRGSALKNLLPRHSERACRRISLNRLLPL